jgi:hypothetical protein
MKISKKINLKKIKNNNFFKNTSKIQQEAGNVASRSMTLMPTSQQGFLVSGKIFQVWSNFTILKE